MNEYDIVEYLEKYFKESKNPVLKFINYSADDTEILVKGTVREWQEFFKEHVK